MDKLYEKDFLLNKLCEIDESNGNKYQEEISSFIIKKTDDKKITEYLNSVREEVILYTGLNSVVITNPKYKIRGTVVSII